MFQGKFLVQNLSALLELIKPQECPYKLIRIGGNNDGAYLIPDDLKGIKVCFSPGVSNRKDFEDHLAKKFRIKSYLCDFSSDTNKFKTVLGGNIGTPVLNLNVRQDTFILHTIDTLESMKKLFALQGVSTGLSFRV